VAKRQRLLLLLLLAAADGTAAAAAAAAAVVAASCACKRLPWQCRLQVRSLRPLPLAAPGAGAAAAAAGAGLRSSSTAATAPAPQQQRCLGRGLVCGLQLRHHLPGQHLPQALQRSSSHSGRPVRRRGSCGRGLDAGTLLLLLLLLLLRLLPAVRRCCT
jgi:hypothetical protein